MYLLQIIEPFYGKTTPDFEASNQFINLIRSYHYSQCNWIDPKDRVIQGVILWLVSL